MLTPDQYRNSWYTITRPDDDGPIRIHAGFDRRTAQGVCAGLWGQGEYCVIGFGLPRDLIEEN